MNRHLLFQFALILLLSSGAHAVTKTWIGDGASGGTTGQNFNAAANWSPSGVPGSSDDVVITLDDGTWGSIELNADATIASLNVTIPSGSYYGDLFCNGFKLTVNGNTDIVVNSGYAFYVDADNKSSAFVFKGTSRFSNTGTGIVAMYSTSSGSGTIQFRGDVTFGYYALTYNGNEPDFLFNGTGTQTVTTDVVSSYMNMHDIRIGSGNNPIVSLTGSTSKFLCATGALDINGSSTLDINGMNFDQFITSSGALSIASGATLKIGGTGDFPTDFSSYSLNDNSNTIYDGTTQSVTAHEYGNLQFSTSGTKTAAGMCNIDGDLVIDANTTFAASTYTHTLAADFTINGTFSSSTGTIEFDGGAISSITGASQPSFYDLTSSNATHLNIERTIAVTDDLTMNGSSTIDANAAIDGVNVAINSGSSFEEGANVHAISGNWADDGTFTEQGGTINFDGSGTQTLSGSSINYNNFTHSGTGTIALSDNIDINGNTVLSAGTFSPGAKNVSVAGNWTSTGDFFTESTGTVIFDGTGSSVITGSSALLAGAVENVFFDDFDATPVVGWTTGALTGSNSWATGDPMGGNGSTGVGNADPTADYTTANTDNNVYGQGLSASNGDGLGGHYDSSNEYAKTPAIDCSGHTNCSLSFRRYANFENTWDEAYVEISTNNSTWTDLSEPTYPQDVAWTLRTIDISSYADGQATVYIRWRSNSDGSVTYSGWNIDDVTITGSTPSENYAGESFSKFQINKSAGGVTLGSKIIITTSATFTQTNITATSTEFLEFDEDATASGAADASHVNGYVKKRTNTITAFTFPIGNGSLYRPAQITPSSASPTTWTLQYNDSGYGTYTENSATIDHVSSQEYWNISKSGSANSTVQLSWGTNSGGITDYTELGVAHWDPVGSEWEDAGSISPTGNNSAGTVNSTPAWTSYSPFTIYTKIAGNPLPIDLMYFDAYYNGSAVDLKWETATEFNNDYYVVERSCNQLEWTEVAKVAGAGTTNKTRNYYALDERPLKGLSYYRLVQIDFDGKTTYSQIKSVTIKEDISKTDFSIWPNPMRSGALIKYKLEGIETNDKVQFVLHDAVGNMVQNERLVNVSKAGIGSLQVAQNLPSGIYNIQLIGDDIMLNKKLVIQ